ncbi:MAG: serine/threonine-protein kinase [Cyanobacteria bacterium J06638_38]
MQGTILGSRYRVIEYIAKGGFGKTYLAEDTQLPGKDKCVVKQLYPSVDDPYFIKVARRLFKTEAETLNTLGVHNQIPRLMAYFEEDEKFYLVQQYIEGHTLTKELVAGEPWSERKVVELLKDCLGILSFIHAQGVIHRDVKPDNLICRQSDHKLVLVDFGTVKEVIAEQTQLVPATVAVGTKGYMPTEQARGKPRTASDIYALGVIAIQAMTGVHPTQLAENDSGEIIWQDKVQCSSQLKEIVSKMTRYQFKERYQSAQSTIAALASLESKSKPVTPQPEAVQYTPTVQLSDAELAALSRQPHATSINPSSLANDHSILVDPDENIASNVTSSKSASSESCVASSSQAESIKQANPLQNESNSMSKAPKSHKTFATLGIALVVGAIASGGMYFLNQQSTKSAQNSVELQVNSFNAMLEAKDYQGCYDKAIKISTQGDDRAANLMPQEQQQEFEAKCGLAKAQQEASDLKYGAALEIAKTLPRTTQIDAEIQQEIDSWSAQLLADATKIYQQGGNLAKAIEMVKQIPQDSSVRPQVIDAKSSWKAESEANEAIMTTASKALSEEKWLYAKQQATKVKSSSSSMYWQEQAQAIIAQAESAIAETAAEAEATKAIVPLPAIKENYTPATPKISKPITPTIPKAVVPEPTPQPTTRINQDSSEPLRNLGDSDSLPSRPSNSNPQNNAPLRDL